MRRLWNLSSDLIRMGHSDWFFSWDNLFSMTLRYLVKSSSTQTPSLSPAPASTVPVPGLVKVLVKPVADRQSSAKNLLHPSSTNSSGSMMMTLSLSSSSPARMLDCTSRLAR